MKGVHTIYMPVSEVMEEPADVEQAYYHPNMAILQVHMAKRVTTRTGFSCLKLYRIASDKEPFFEQWYGNGTDLDPCGHFDLPNGYQENETCGRCLLGETGEDWKECPTCDLWFHNSCVSL